MKNFVTTVLGGQRININDLYAFIAEYCELKGKTLKNGDIEQIVTLIQHRMFNLDYAIKEYCKIKNYSIVTLSYIQGKPIKVWLNDL